MQLHYHKLVISILLLVGCIFNSVAQNNFVDGIIVSNQNDTLIGQINFKDWYINPTNIEFKIDEKIRNFSPLDIKEFQVENEIYKSAVIKSEISSRKVHALSPNKELSIRIDTSFVRCLIIGNKSLYSNITKEENQNFYIGSDDQYTLLEYKKYANQIGKKKFVSEEKKFSFQLLEYLDKCKYLNSSILEISYTEASIIELFSKYYDQCASGKLAFKDNVESKSEKNKIGLLLGGQVTNLTFNGTPSFEYLNESKFSTALKPVVGMFYELYFKRRRNKISFVNEISYNYFQTDAQYEDRKHENHILNYDIRFNYHYVDLNTLFRVRVIKKRFNFFGNVGTTFGKLVSFENDVDLHTVFFTDERTNKITLNDKPRELEMGFLGGLGIEYNKLKLELRLEIANGISDIVGLSSKTLKGNLLVSYSF